MNTCSDYAYMVINGKILSLNGVLEVHIWIKYFAHLQRVVVNNNCFDEGDMQNCMLRSSVESIISFTNGLSVVDKKIDEQLKSINDNTGSDHSYSFEINNRLDSIENLLEKLT